MQRHHKTKPPPQPVEETSEDDETRDEADDEEAYEAKPKAKTSKVPKSAPLKIHSARLKPEKKVAKDPVTVGDVKVGIVYTKAGKRQLYETPSKRYYTVREDGSRTYVTARITSDRLKVYDE